MAFRIEINAEALAKVERKIRSIKSIDLKSVLPAVLEATKAQVAENFASETDGNGNKWQRLAPGTQKDRVRRGYSAASPILVRTGALRAAATDRLNGKVDGNLLSIGITDRKLARIAGYQQSGTGRIPPRPFLTVSAKLSARIAEIVATAQSRQIAQALAAD